MPIPLVALLEIIFTLNTAALAFIESKEQTGIYGVLAFVNGVGVFGLLIGSILATL